MEKKDKLTIYEKNYIKSVIKYIFKKKTLIIWYITTAIITTITGAITPYISAQLLSHVTNYIPRLIIIFLLLNLVINLLESIFSYLSSIITEKIEQDIILHLKDDFTKDIYKLETKNFDKEGTGFFADKMLSEPTTIAYTIFSLRYKITNILGSIGIFVYLTIISWEITICTLLLSLVMVLIEKHRTNLWESYKKENNELSENFSSDFTEFIHGVRDIKVLNIKNYIQKKIYTSQKKISETEIAFIRKTRLHSNFSYIFHDVANFLIILLGIYLIYLNRLDAANLLVIYMYLSRVFNFSNSISDFYDLYKRTKLSIKRLCELTEGKLYPKEKFGNKNIKSLSGDIEFKNVNFAYKKKTVLKNTSFKIKKNTTVGFVGKSGQGKTTIFNLISKLYSTNDNTIFIDNYDINTLTENSIRNNISVITQNPYIFNTTIYENLKMINSKASKKDILKYSKMCSLDEFINTLDDKYNTKIGENGVVLSGGQKQRLALTRALIKDNNIILLDEATSALDNNTQYKIHESIKKISKSKQKTILIIAHRLSTIINCDKIFVVDKGKIISEGTHEELINNCKLYQNLYKNEKF